MSAKRNERRNSLPTPPSRKLYKVKQPNATQFPQQQQELTVPCKSRQPTPRKLESSSEAVSSATVLLQPQESTDQQDPGGWRLIRCLSKLVCGESPEEEAQVSMFASVSRAVPSAPKPKPKAKAPGPPPKAKGPPPPPPKATPTTRRQSWKGQKPSPKWKTDKVVNCSPIRQVGLLEGSVWQQVNQTIEQRGDEAPLCEDILNSAFMRLADESKGKGSREQRNKKVEKRRILPPKDALKADLLHKQLVRQGLCDLERLLPIVGVRPQPVPEIAGFRFSESSFSSITSSSSSESTDSDSSFSDSDDSREGATHMEAPEDAALDEDVLQILLDFLHLADSHEDQLTTVSGPKPQLPLAASEHLLQQLLLQVGPAAFVQSRVTLMLTIIRFPKEVEHLEKMMRSGIDAARAVVKSTALPQLLQGYLLLVNYVNYESQQLGSARGVTLDSIAKLAHTRCRPSPQKEGLQNTKRTPQKSTNALDLLVRQVQEKQEPNWLASLTADLEGCREACDLDYAVISACIKDLATQVTAIKERICSLKASRNNTGEPPALMPARLTQFVASASPRLSALRSLQEDLESATADMRKYFAEPPTSPLPGMLHSLATLLDALPRPEPAGTVRNLDDKFNKCAQESIEVSPHKAKPGGG